MDTTVLLSGGSDSAAAIAFYRRVGHEVTGIFVDYGQPVRQRERESAQAIASHYGFTLAEISVSSTGIIDYSGEIRGRNAFLLFTALMFSPPRSGILALGIHSGTPYYDCSERFANDAQQMVDSYSGGRIALGLPFLKWTKPMISDFAETEGVPIHLTWSCEVGPTNECGQCLSCLDRKGLRERRALNVR